MMSEYVTVAEASKLAGVSHDTMRRWCADGWLSSAVKRGKTWFVLREEVLAFEQPRRGLGSRYREEENDGS